MQIFVREAGRNRTNPISAFHPEIRNPADLLPTELGCAAATPGAPQLIVTNVAVAAGMLSAYYAWLEGRLAYEESYLDVAAGVKVALERELL